MSLPNIDLTLSSGEKYPFTHYDDYVLLIVNTATQCGLTKQMHELTQLHTDYQSHKFAVLGFPCNQFAGQEPISDADMQQTCQLQFGTNFPLHQKCDVNGEQTHPLYQWLKKAQGGLLTDDIKWNFTKFLIDRNGHVVKRYAPTTAPHKLIKDIESLL